MKSVDMNKMKTIYEVQEPLCSLVSELASLWILYYATNNIF